LIEGDELGLGAVNGSNLPVRITIRPTDDSSGPVDLRRGWCHGNQCVGSFTILFRRDPATMNSMSFNWAIAAAVNFATSDVPDGAAIDVVFT